MLKILIHKERRGQMQTKEWREMRKLKFALAMNPLASNKTILQRAGIDRGSRLTNIV